MKDTNTQKSFEDKWYKNKDLVFENTLKEGSEIQNWILNRNGWKNLSELQGYLKDKTRILDAGCGNGRVTKLLKNCTHKNQEIIGIDLVSHKIAESNLHNDQNVHFYKKDLLDNLKDLGKFDFIYSQEVLHHTKNPKKAFSNLVRLLNKNGEIAIYVYKQKAPVREFTDDYLREKIVDYDYDEAMKISRNITKLGKVLSGLNLSIDIPEIKELGIKEGNYDIQRFLWCYYAWKENNLIMIFGYIL